MKRHKPLLLALILGSSAAVLSFTSLSAYVRTGSVVVAQREISQYSRIGPKDARLTEMPLKAISPSAFTRIEDVLGSYAISKILPGQIIDRGHVVSGKNEIGVSFDIALGERGLLIPVARQRACGGLIKEGDCVDVTWVPKGREVSNGEISRGSFTVLQSVRVIGLTFDPSSKEIDGILVQVTPDVCEKMAYYIESGSLYVSLVPKKESESSGVNHQPGDGVFR